MSKVVSLNAEQVLVLRVLAGLGDEWFMPFAPIAKRTGLDVRAVRRACRSLKRKGLSVFKSGLWTEDGDLAGAGYSATEAGRALIADDDVLEITG